MLKLYFISYFRKDDPNEILSRFVLAYNRCHAVNLLYREFDSHGELNIYCHSVCEEVSCINPAQFKEPQHGNN